MLIVIGAGAVVPTGEASIERAYPATDAKQGAPFQLAPLQDSNQQVLVSGVDEKNVTIEVPVEASGVADGYLAMPNDVKVSIDAASGAHWSSPWQAAYNAYYRPGPQESSVSFRMPRRILEEFRGGPVALHLTLAFTKLRAEQTRSIAMPATNFAVPGFGVCASQIGWDGSEQITGIACRAAFHHPALTYIEAIWSNGPCAGGATDPENGVQGAAWAGEVHPEPAAFGITSVWTVPVALSNGWRETGDRAQPQKARHLCPGTPLRFTLYAPVTRGQAGITIQNFHFPAHDHRGDAAQFDE